MEITKTTSKESLIANWVVDIEERAKNTTESFPEDFSFTRCIYKVPAFLREGNPKAFTPQVISFGPFHHGNPELKAMEVHKENGLVHFIRKSNQSLQNIVEEVAKIITKLRDAYHGLSDRWMGDDEEFLRMMIVDGCFMLELLQFFDLLGGTNTRVFDKPFFFSLGNKLPYIRRDMLLIENQLPLFLLKALVPFQSIRDQHVQYIDCYISGLVLNYVASVASDDDPTISPRTTLGLHALDLFRKSLLNPDIANGYSTQPILTNTLTITHCAVELREAGVRFKKSKTRYLNDIRFNTKTGKFHLPFLVVDDAMLNIIAFEQLHHSMDHEVMTYFCILDDMINSAKDVSLLKEKGIVLNALGSDEEFARLFNNIAKQVTVSHSNRLLQVRRDVFLFCQKKTNRWIANFIQTYFKSPWTVFSLLGALLVIVLTFIQTVYTVRGK